MKSLRRHRWWLLPELVLVAAVLVVGLVHLRSGGLAEQLAERARLALERLPPGELELYDGRHAHGASGARVICVAETFGMRPATASSVARVRVVYVRYLCALVEAGTPWDFASRSSGPAVITLSDPPAVHIVRSGPGFPDRVRAVFPDSVHAQALADFQDRGKPAALVARYREAAALSS